MTIEQDIASVEYIIKPDCPRQEIYEAFERLCRDARLGALVREMPDKLNGCDWIQLGYSPKTTSWDTSQWEDDECLNIDSGSTPEAALLAAKEGKVTCS